MSRVSLCWRWLYTNSHAVFACVFKDYFPLTFFFPKHFLYFIFSLISSSLLPVFLVSLQFPSLPFTLPILYSLYFLIYFSFSCIQFLQVNIFPFPFLFLPLLYILLFPFPHIPYFFFSILSCTLYGIFSFLCHSHIFFLTLVYSLFLLLYSNLPPTYFLFNNILFSESLLI